MRLTFHGTLASIRPGNVRHARQSMLEVAYGGRRLLIDCGDDWRGRLPTADPVALLLTHAHDDHVGGLVNGMPCPVYAHAATWERIQAFPLRQQRVITPRKPFYVAGIRLTAFAVQHSPRAPTVGYRIQAGCSTVFYCPDVACIPDRHRVLRGVQLFIGDGTAVHHTLLRLEDGMLYGHAPLPNQLRWCAEEGVPRMLASHCGEEILGDERQVAHQLHNQARKLRIKADIAYDGMTLKLP
jgi:phosphoribosyl 1,2-cyclic phosphodiesterase